MLLCEVASLRSTSPTRNALISRSDSSNDRLDARRLGLLDRARAIHEVYVPPEPYRTLRSLVHYDHMMATAFFVRKDA